MGPLYFDIARQDLDWHRRTRPVFRTGLFMVTLVQGLYYGSVQTMPFVRPHFSELVGALISRSRTTSSPHAKNIPATSDSPYGDQETLFRCIADRPGERGSAGPRFPVNARGRIIRQHSYDIGQVTPLPRIAACIIVEVKGINADSQADIRSHWRLRLRSVLARARLLRH